MAFLVIMLCFGVATAFIARAKGSSFFIWLLSAPSPGRSGCSR